LKKSVFYGIRKVTVAKQQNYMYKVNHIRQGKLFHVFRSSKHSHTTGKQINQSCEALQMYALTDQFFPRNPVASPDLQCPVPTLPPNTGYATTSKDSLRARCPSCHQTHGIKTVN